MKNLKKLSKKAMQTIKGSETVYIQCDNGTTGQAHNVETFAEIAKAAKMICKGGGFDIS